MADADLLPSPLTFLLACGVSPASSHQSLTFGERKQEEVVRSLNRAHVQSSDQTGNDLRGGPGPGR